MRIPPEWRFLFGGLLMLAALAILIFTCQWWASPAVSR
jgi:hypothetical protein